MIFTLVINGLGLEPPNCGSGGRRFETALPPFLNNGVIVKLTLFYCLWGNVWGNDLIIF